MSEFKVMLAHTYSKERIDSWKNVVVEPKVDGVRVIVLINKRSTVNYYSRNGRELHMFSGLDEQMRELAKRCGTMLAYEGKTSDIDKGMMFDGEMTAATFGEIAGAIHRKNYTATDAKYQCFHAMPLRCFEAGVDDVPQAARRAMLSTLLGANGHTLSGLLYAPGTPVDSDSGVRNAYQRHRKRGHEGTMVKVLSKPWIAARSHAWLKIKGEETLDLKVTGMKIGTGKYKGTCGAIIVDHKGVQVPVSGMLDAQRHQFWKERDGKNSIIGRTVEVEFQEVTVHGSLRHPRFKRVRDDK